MKPALPLPQGRVAAPGAPPIRRRRAALLVPGAAGFALILLVLAVAVDRLSVRATSYVNLRLELVVGGLVGAWALWHARSTWRAGLGRIEGGLLGWLLAGALASLLFAPERGDSLKFAVLGAGLLTLYLAARLLLRTPQAVTWGALAWVAVGAGVCLLGLIEALLYITVGATGGISFNRLYSGGILSAVPAVYSTLWEANIFGSYALTVAILAVALGAAPAFAAPAWQGAWRGALAVACCGMILSMTRTVWAVGALVLALVALLAWRRGLVGGRRLLAGVLAPAALGLAAGLLVGTAMPTVSWPTPTPWAFTTADVERLSGQIIRGEVAPAQIATPADALPLDPDPAPNPALPPRQDSAFVQRLTELFQLGHVPTWLIRQEVFVNAIAGWTRRPLLGWGFNSYQYVYPPAPHTGYWVGNLELHLLFDTGLIGLLLFGGAVALAVVRGLRALRPPRAAWTTTHYALFGLLSAGLGLFLTYQLTEGTWLGFTWIWLALLVAAGQQATAVTTS